MEDPLRYEAVTGLTRGRLAKLPARTAGVIEDVAVPAGRPAARVVSLPGGSVWLLAR
jgi:hypothetical protein